MFGPNSDQTNVVNYNNKGVSSINCKLWPGTNQYMVSLGKTSNTKLTNESLLKDIDHARTTTIRGIII
jgi:hypothetical protein